MHSLFEIILRLICIWPYTLQCILETVARSALHCWCWKSRPEAKFQSRWCGWRGQSSGHCDGGTTPPPACTICISWHGHREWRWRYIFDDICLERLDCCITGHIFNIHITWWKVVRRLILLYTATKCRFGSKNCFICWCTFRHILQDDSDIFPIAQWLFRNPKSC